VAAPIVAETAVRPEGRQVPLPFEPRYDSSRIEPNRSYALRAAIRSAGRTLFATDTAYPVITQGHPTEVDLLFMRISEGTEKAPSSLWGPVAPRGSRRGRSIRSSPGHSSFPRRKSPPAAAHAIASSVPSKSPGKKFRLVHWDRRASPARKPWGHRRGNTSRCSKRPSGSRSMGLRS